MNLCFRRLAAGAVLLVAAASAPLTAAAQEARNNSIYLTPTVASPMPEAQGAGQIMAVSTDSTDDMTTLKAPPASAQRAGPDRGRSRDDEPRPRVRCSDHAPGPVAQRSGARGAGAVPNEELLSNEQAIANGWAHRNGGGIRATGIRRPERTTGRALSGCRADFPFRYLVGGEEYTVVAPALEPGARVLCAFVAGASGSGGCSGHPGTSPSFSQIQLRRGGEHGVPVLQWPAQH